MGRTSLSLIAGRSLLTCVPYIAVNMRRLLMFRRTIAPNWTNNERAFTNRADARRRILLKQPLYGPFVSPRINCPGGDAAHRRRGLRVSAPTKLFLALSLCICRQSQQ